jgi:transposase-like protein
MKIIAAAETVEIGKHDEQGRRIADLAEKQALVAAFEQSGLTQRAFARQEGINYFTLATWLRNKRLRAAKAAAPARPRFLEVGLRPGTGFSLEVTLPGGVVIRGSQSAELIELVKALR